MKVIVNCVNPRFDGFRRATIDETADVTDGEIFPERYFTGRWYGMIVSVVQFNLHCPLVEGNFPTRIWRDTLQVTVGQRLVIVVGCGRIDFGGKRFS